MKSKALTTAMAIALGTGLAASAIAAPPHLYKEHAVKVSYNDINIENDAGVRILYRRLKNASAEVCGRGSRTSNRSSATGRRCRGQCSRSTVTSSVSFTTAKLVWTPM